MAFQIPAKNKIENRKELSRTNKSSLAHIFLYAIYIQSDFYFDKQDALASVRWALNNTNQNEIYYEKI